MPDSRDERNMELPHEPSTEFTQYLEWQTRTELRRGDRFDREAPAAPRITRFARIAALVLVSLFAGAGVVVAAERIQESRLLEILLERNRVRLELAERRVAAAETVEQTERLRYEQGITSGDDVAAATARVAELEQQRDHLALDREEMERSRRDVDGRLTAPLVGTRDFVSEHLRIDRVFLTEIVEIRAATAEVARLRFENGITTASDMNLAKRGEEAARGELARIDERLALRADFLLGRIEALDCETRDLVGDAEYRRTSLEGDKRALDVELEYARQLESSGFGSGLVAPLESELDAIEVELRLIELELELLR